jgi:exodeoxyribonuclease (lambda-induced)
MQILNLEQRTPEWLEARRGKVTGTGLKKILGRPQTRTDYFYEVLAERLTSEGLEEGESAMQRGVRLEPEALEAFEAKTKKKVEIAGLCVDDQNEWIANSPDGLIKVKGKYREAAEIKCLSSANHLKVWLENKIPDDHMAQAMQYFILNKDLEILHFASYDPRMTMHPLHIIKLKREDIEEDIAKAKEAEEKFINEVNAKFDEIVKL